MLPQAQVFPEAAIVSSSPECSIQETAPVSAFCDTERRTSTSTASDSTLVLQCANLSPANGAAAMAVAAAAIPISTEPLLRVPQCCSETSCSCVCHCKCECHRLSPVSQQPIFATQSAGTRPLHTSRRSQVTSPHARPMADQLRPAISGQRSVKNTTVSFARRDSPRQRSSTRSCSRSPVPRKVHQVSVSQSNSSSRNTIRLVDVDADAADPATQEVLGFLSKNSRHAFNRLEPRNRKNNNRK